MDCIFHITSAAWLAHKLGERRTSQLTLAGFIGILPDLIAHGVVFLGLFNPYQLTHSLTFNIPLLIIIMFYNPRIAWGGILHIVVDVFTHTYATRYLFYPFARFFIPIGTTWWRGPGLFIWAGLWVVLLWLIARDYRKYQRKKMLSSDELFFPP